MDDSDAPDALSLGPLVAGGLFASRFAARTDPGAAARACSARREGRCPGVDLCAHCPWSPPVTAAGARP